MAEHEQEHVRKKGERWKKNHPNVHLPIPDPCVVQYCCFSSISFVHLVNLLQRWDLVSMVPDKHCLFSLVTGVSMASLKCRLFTLGRLHCLRWGLHLDHSICRPAADKNVTMQTWTHSRRVMVGPQRTPLPSYCNFVC